MDSRQRQTRTTTIVRMSVLLSVVTGLLGLLGTPLAAEEPTPGGTLTVGLAADIAHFDVFLAGRIKLGPACIHDQVCAGPAQLVADPKGFATNKDDAHSIG